MTTVTDATNAQPQQRLYTSKQMGDACEMLVAAELTLAGIPALKVPDLWPDYDVLAQPQGRGVQRISVKSRTYKRRSGHFVDYNARDIFDWIAIVLLQCEGDKSRRIFIVPRHVADETSKRDRDWSDNPSNQCYWPIAKVATILGRYEDNFVLAD